MVTRPSEQEWYAWRFLCHLLAEHGININTEDTLAAALRYYAEQYRQLFEGTGKATYSAAKDAELCEPLINRFIAGLIPPRPGGQA